MSTTNQSNTYIILRTISLRGYAFSCFHSSAFSLILSACLQESSTHGVGLFAVKGMKTGHFTDIDCFGTFVLYYTKTEVHDTIAADGVPRYI